MKSKVLAPLGYALLLIVVSAICVLATTTATLTGRVTDPTDAVIPGVRIEATNVNTNITYSATTNEVGLYVIPNLPPGRYRIFVRKESFRTIVKPDVVLHVQDVLAQNFTLQIGSVAETVTVEAGGPVLDAEAAQVDTVVNRQFIANLPMNGRSFHTLIQLTPGAVVVRAAPNPFLSQGQFSVNGQRINANYFTLDGVSANSGVSLGNSPNQHAVGSLPDLTAFGGTNNLASVDALEEFRIQTSTYAPEFGRQPGAQISIATRSGGNEFHGSVFNYFRNDALDATDWFSNSRRLKKAPLRQNDFGGVIGGPILKDRTFFFFSYEGLRLREPQFMISVVPAARFRQLAPPQFKPLFEMFPIPNGADLGNDTAEFVGTFSAPSFLNAYSIRVDHTWSKLHLFGRYNHAPSGITNRTFGRIYNENPTRAKTQFLTIAGILSITPTVMNDFRANVSRARGRSVVRIAEIGGNVVPSSSALLPSFTSLKESIFAVFMASFSIGAIVGNNVNNQQRQVNLVDTVSVVRGAHHLKFGVDWRRLSPTFGLRPYDNIVIFNRVADALAGIASQASVVATDTNHTFFVNNLSLYAQDTWRASRRLTLTYGVRWEYNPPPSAKDNKLPFTVKGLDNPATMTLAPQGTRLWAPTHNNFAPRVGVAYQPSQNLGLVLKGGVGLFYDLGTGSALFGAANFPWRRTRNLFGVPWPLDAASAAPPPFSLNPPVDFGYAFDPNLKLPYSIQWNVAIEKSLGPNQTVSSSYVAAVGRRLLRQEALVNPNPNFQRLQAITNTATSDYHALQLQFQRRLSRGLQALVNYTWSHSIDDISDEVFSSAPVRVIDPHQDRGSSDYDVRHAFTAAVTYDIPSPATQRVAKAILGDWSIDTIARATSAFPINVFAGRDVLSIGLTTVVRPDLVPGVPMWIDDPSQGPGRRLNRAAFSIPVGRQGNLGRNALRGFGMFQVDFGLRRQFVLTERLNLQFRADFFNIFNHPNFADPVTNASSGLFGRSTQMLGRSLGSGGLTGGFSPLYNNGGPRSIQLALKFLF